MNRAERRHRTRTVKARARQPWRKMSYPWALRGARHGMHEFANLRNRADRARVRDALTVIDTNDPYADVASPAHRHSAEWDLW